MAHPKILAFILAGGKGERLFPLTAMRSKPSVPFGSRFRIIDFVLSNHINSHIYSIYLLIQYKSQSLIEHIRKSWVLSPVARDHFIALVPPQMRMGPEWFQGTADAVFQNAALIKDNNPELVFIFGADHIYRMDMRQMIDFHIERDADVTVAARPVPIEEGYKFGIIVVDDENRIVEFQEKPKNPKPMPGDPTRCYASMGNYLFQRDVILEGLADAKRRGEHDFGAHVIPALVPGGKVFAYDFATNVVPGVKPHEEPGYWRDVGTIKAYYDAHVDMLGPRPAFDLANAQWPIHSAGYAGQGAKIVRADVRDAIFSEGVYIDGATVKNSVLRSGVTLEEGVEVENSIIMDGVTVKKGARLKNVIIDKHNIVEEGSVIGFDPEKDRFSCHIDPCGIGIIPRKGKKDRADDPA